MSQPMRRKGFDGQLHDLATWVTVPATVGLISLINPGAIPISVVSHLLSGIWFSPDLDLKGHIRCRCWHRWRRLGLGGLWDWYPRFVPKHRHYLSHGILIGSAIRMLPIWAFLAWANPVWLLPAYIGAEIAVVTHLIVDSKGIKPVKPWLMALAGWVYQK